MLYSVNSPILRGCLVMAHISGEDRSQVLLLLDAVEDYVGPDNPVRFIDAFVDSLDLEASGFGHVRPRETGRPGYDPADLLKLYIYGYLNRVRSSRRLEAETHRNLEVIWLMRRLRPDFKTIADFRRDNRPAFREVFRAFVRVSRELDLYGRELIAVDGTCIKAVNHRDRNFTQAKLKSELQRIDARLERHFERMNEADAEEGGCGTQSDPRLQEKIESMRKKKERLEGYRKSLEESGEAVVVDGPGFTIDACRDPFRCGLQRAGCGGYQTPPDCRAAGSRQGDRLGSVGGDGYRGSGESRG